VGATGAVTAAIAPFTLTGCQLAFPVTQNASADANTLDDYEEGTWTPNVGGDATYTAQVGRYTKIGRHVFVVGDMTINVKGTGAAGTISGLPFTAAVGNDPATVSYFTGFASNVVLQTAFVSTTNISLVGLAAAGVSTAATKLLTNGTRVIVGAHYTV
jgi:hypothetical protein